MKRTLGIDLGTNSIGWALVEDNQIKELGTQIFASTNQNTTLKEVKTSLIDKFKKLSSNKKIATGLIATMTILTLVNFENWQFWLGLSISSLLTFLSINK